MSVENLILLAGGAFVGSVLAAVAGFGGAAVLLPLLVAAFGVREAIPILTVAQLLGKLSRAWFREQTAVSDLPNSTNSPLFMLVTDVAASINYAWNPKGAKSALALRP